MTTGARGRTWFLAVSSRQRFRGVNLLVLRGVLDWLLNELLGLEAVELEINLITRPEITRLNRQFLGHEGPTDVITFDYSEARSRRRSPAEKAKASASPGKCERRTRPIVAAPLPKRLHGELFICVEEAVLQAAGFRTRWTSELVRYAVHGVLHLCGFDDSLPSQRREMKRVEDKLLRKLQRRFALCQVAAHRQS
jgi:probable rRNA maturation factor